MLSNVDGFALLPVDDNGDGPLYCYHYTSMYRSEDYQKLQAFNTREQRTEHKKDTADITEILNRYLVDPDQTPESVQKMVTFFHRYSRKWGYSRVPATIRLAVNFKQEKADLRITDYGKDAGVTMGIPYLMPGHFEPVDGAIIEYSLTDCLPPMEYVSVHQYNCELDGRDYQKYIPCVDDEEENGFIHETMQLYRQMIMLVKEVPKSKALIGKRRSGMKKMYNKSKDYLNKWGLARVPGNIRKATNVYEFILGTTEYTDFGPDVGVQPGTTPYENINFEETVAEFADFVLPKAGK